MSAFDLVTRWRTRADELEPFAHGAAEAFRRAATELEAELRTADDAVTLREASFAGGYSIDHLGRMIAEGKLENVGRKNRPRVRRSDIPRKPGHALPSTPERDQFSARRRIVAAALTADRETP